jgi:hypothetical protein
VHESHSFKASGPAGPIVVTELLYAWDGRELLPQCYLNFNENPGLCQEIPFAFFMIYPVFPQQSTHKSKRITQGLCP